MFYSVPWSHGTLGFLVAAELKIIPCKKYVKLEYIPLYSEDDVISTFATESQKGNPSDFVEGLMYSKNKGVVMLGKMVNKIDPNKVFLISNYLFFLKFPKLALTSSYI